MSITGTSSISAGTVMTWSGIEANLAQWRTWMNGGVVIGDMAAAGLTRENLYRPEWLYTNTTGTSNIRYVGQTQQLVSSNRRLEEPHAADVWDGSVIQAGEWRTRRDREILKLQDIPQNEIYATSIGARLYLPRQSIVGVRCQLDGWLTRSPSTSAGDIYPSGGGAGVRAGALMIMTYNHATDTDTERTESRQHVYPPRSGEAFVHDRYELECSLALGAGDWDVYVAYKRGGLPGVTNADWIPFWQLDIGRTMFQLEVLDNKVGA